MKTIYQFLIVFCLISLFTFQDTCDKIEPDDIDDCMVDKVSISGFTCCFYNGTWKVDGDYTQARCA